MGWKQFVRQVEAAARAHEREQRANVRRAEREVRALNRERSRSHREWLRTQRLEDKEAARQRDASEVEEYETYLEGLITLHRECIDPVRWEPMSQLPPPIEPVWQNPAETAARAALEAYAPGFFERLLGNAKQQRLALEEAIAKGARADEWTFKEAMRLYEEHRQKWLYQVELAKGVLQQRIAAWRTALQYFGAFEELVELGTRVALESVSPDAVTVTCTIEDEEIVPDEELKLTAGGKLSKKNMAVGKYWSIYLDHIASCVIRVGREVLAILPTKRAIVNLRVRRVDPSTGHHVTPTVLGVHFTRDALWRLNFAAIDPSESLKNFPHRLKFKKTAGFDPVEDMSADEQWITT